jgi:MoaA/NifB/PqqE/SkfB family radical SAM enzyme
MIGISKLYCGTVEPSDALRYGRHSSTLPSHLLQFSKDKRPVVVWNVTRKCNLKCVHCYAQATEEALADELSTDEGKALIDDLAQFGAPVMLFSGGEPLVRKDLPELAAYAVDKGMRAVISTNGTLITPSVARTLKSIGLSYVGISLDGMQGINDKFRGVPGAYDKALDGIRNCQDAGIKVGLRFTINKFNVGEIPAIFDLLENMNIPRVCFYHLVYAGRGSKMVEEDLTLEETRKAVDLIIDRTKALHDKGIAKEVLTVDNHADGPYLYLRLLKENPERAAEVLELLKMNEGNNSGRGIGCLAGTVRCMPTSSGATIALATSVSGPSRKSGRIRKMTCCSNSRKRNCMSRGAAQPAIGSTSAAEISAFGPKRSPMMSGRLIRPVISQTKRSPRQFNPS